MVTINLGRREAIFFGSVLMIFLAVGFAVSLNSGNYLIHGHDAGEIGNLPEGGSGSLPTCLEGQVLKVDVSGEWVCGSDVSSSGSTGAPMPNCAEGQILKADSSGALICGEDKGDLDILIRRVSFCRNENSGFSGQFRCPEGYELDSCKYIRAKTRYLADSKWAAIWYDRCQVGVSYPRCTSGNFMLPATSFEFSYKCVKTVPQGQGKRTFETCEVPDDTPNGFDEDDLVC